MHVMPGDIENNMNPGDNKSDGMVFVLLEGIQAYIYKITYPG